MVEPGGQGEGEQQDHAGDEDAVAQHGLVGALALEAGRGGQQGGDGADERSGDGGGEEQLEHGFADIGHGSHAPAAVTRTAATARTRAPARSTVR